MIPVNNILRIVRNLILSIQLLLVCSFIAHGEELENYCHDEQANLEWKAVETKAGVHPDLVHLSKYRTELCEKVDSGEMPHEEATILFEIERERVLEKIKAGNL